MCFENNAIKLLHMTKLIGIFFSSIFLFGCAADGIHDYQSLAVAQDHITEPTLANQFTGLLTDTSTAPPGALERRAAEICNPRGGLKSSPQFAFRNNIWGWNVYRYQCYGHITANSRDIPQALVQSPPQKQIQPERRVGLELEEAKSKCLDLGFTKNTEGFGKCVLRLTK